MSRLGTYFSNIVKTALYTIQPNKVEEYPYEQYAAEYYICERILELYHSFIFYKIANYFEMIYVPPAASIDTPSRERRVFSLFRFQGDVDDGISSFKRIAEVVHKMSNILDIYDIKVNKVWLEKVTTMHRCHPRWTLAHISACLDFDKAFNHEQVLRWLNAADMDTGETPLHVAVKSDSLETVRKLLTLKQLRLDVCDNAGNTLLHAAVEKNALVLIEALLDIEPPSNCENVSIAQPTRFKKNTNRININAMNKRGETCLFQAVRGVSESVVAALLRAGADARVGTTDYLPIHLAAEKDLIWCVDLLFSYYPEVLNLQTPGSKLSPLHIAKAKKQTFTRLLDLGANPNLRNLDGRTVLHQAVQEQDLDTVMVLLIHGADVNISDNRGISPLHLAVARCQDVHIVYALIVFEADPNTTDAEGLSPRHWLCQHESGIYQRNATRDIMLYALDVVQAQRCPMGRRNCTSGCIAPSCQDQLLSDVQQQKNQRSFSYSYLTQLLQDMPFTSPRPNADPTGELFNGTPPDPVLTNTDLTKDKENDLFFYFSDGNSLSPLFSSIKSSPPRHRSSDPQPTRSASPDQTLAEVAEGTNECSPKADAVEAEVAAKAQQEEIDPAATSQVTQSWFWRTVMSRFLSATIPGLESMLSFEAISPEGGGTGPSLSTQQPPEAEAVQVPADESAAIGAPVSSTEKTARLQNLHPNSQKQQWQKSFHHHLGGSSVQSCSGRPGVSCCLERNAKCSSPSPDGTIEGLPSATLSLLCPPTTEDVAWENTQQDPEGFRASQRGYRVLCLDGGGIRGLVLCQVLRAIERAAGRPIRDLYDWVIGTSTGAMLALNIAMGKCVRYNRCLYFRLKEKVFVGNRPYPTESFENLLREEFGEGSVMSDLTGMRVSVTALRGDHFPPRLHIFRNYPAPYEQMERLVSELLKAKSTSATPSASTAVCPDTTASSTAPPLDPVEVVSAIPPPADVPYKCLLNAFLGDLFGETLHEVGRDGEDESDLQENIVFLLSSFSRRYMYGSKGVEQPVPVNEQTIWQAARASGAAPSYFRACGPYLDGGLIANNPTMDVLTEAQELNIVRRLRREPTISIASVTSLGTGRVPLREVQQLDVFMPQNMSEAYRVAMGVTELSRMLVEMATMSEGRIVERSRAWCSSLGVPFFRFSPLLSVNVALDATSTRIILQMLWETEAYLCNCHDRILRLVNSLLHASDSPPSSSPMAFSPATS